MRVSDSDGATRTAASVVTDRQVTSNNSCEPLREPRASPAAVRRRGFR